MRFVLAIVASVIAAVLILLGIGQRTIWAPPESVSLSTTTSGDAAYAVIDGDALDAYSGRQTITVSGDGALFMAFGRSSDVAAWVGSSPADVLAVDAETDALTSEVVTAEPAVTLSEEARTANDAITDPRGADIWLEEYEGDGTLTVPISVTDDFSVLLATDGTAPAPTTVSLSWPLDGSTPLAGPLFLGGGIALAAGLILWVLALVHVRRQRGPRRRGPQGKMPKLPRSPRYRPSAPSSIGVAPKSRRSTRGLIAVPVVLGTLLLTSCSAEYWPQIAATDAPATATPTPVATDGSADVAPAAVLSTTQATTILQDVAAVAALGDESRDAAVLETRFTGAALQLRTANYQIRQTLADFAAPQAIPTTAPRLVLPQATSTWPRVVLAVLPSAEGDTAAPVTLLLSQASPRANYLVDYAIALEAGASIPPVAPAEVGASIVAPDSRLMLLPPGQVSTAYSDLLANGDASQYAGIFDREADTLEDQIGVTKKEADRAALPSTASIEFTNGEGVGADIALATNDSGALVLASADEISTVKPVEEGATVSTAGASQALLGAESSTTGIVTTYAHQLLFYVPPTGSKEKIVLLGYSEGLISAVQLP